MTTRQSPLKPEHSPTRYGSRLMLVVFQQDEKNASFEPGLVLDLDATGATILTGKRLKKDSFLTLRVELMENRSFNLKCRVKWSIPVTNPPIEYHIHSNYMQKIEFLDISPEVSKAIVLYVCNWLLMEATEEDEPRESLDSAQQQRRYLRAPLTLTILCRDRNNTHFSITTKNVSSRGIQFTTNHKIAAGDEFTLQIQLDLSIPTIETDGRVAWVKEPEDGTYEAGLQFTALMVHNRKSIARYLANALSG